MMLSLLGSSGGIGGALRTSAMLLDHDILIDAGSGFGELSHAEMSVIDHLFLTHSHLDVHCIFAFDVGWNSKYA